MHTNAYSQNIVRGQITDISGSSISNAIIEIKGTEYKTFSDKDGHYLINIPKGKDFLVFKHKDFKYQEIEITDSIINVKLSNEIPELLSVLSIEEMMRIKVITAGKKEQEVSEIPASVVIITRKEIEKYGYSSLKEIIENIPGFFATNSYSGSDIVFGVRGFYSSYNRNVMIMVNGVSKLLDYNYDFALHNINVPVKTIDRIEFIRGPRSVIYGNNAFFGAINIITNNTDDEQLNFSQSIGNQNSLRTAFKLSKKINQLKVAIGAGYFYTDGPNHALKKMVKKYVIDDNNNTVLNPLWNRTTEKLYDREEKYFNINTKYKDWYFDMSYSETYKGQSYLSFPPDYYYFHTAFFQFKTGLRHHFTDKIRLDLHGMYDYYFTEAQFKFSTSNSYGPLFDLVSSYYIGADVFYNPIDKIKLTFGSKLHITDLSTEQYDLIEVGNGSLERVFINIHKNEDVIEHSHFMQIEYQPFNALQLVLGSRIEKTLPYKIFLSRKTGMLEEMFIDATVKNSSNLVFTPRIAAILSVNNKNTLKFLYSKAIRQTPPVVNIDILIYNSTYNENEDFLLAEKVTAHELNYRNIFNEKLTFDFNIFYNNLDNLLVRDVKFVNGSYAPITSNSGKLITFGSELLLYYQPIKKIFTEFSVSYQKTENKRKGCEHIKAPFSPKFLAYAKYTHSITKTIFYSFTANYIDKMYPVWIGDTETGAYQGDETDGFWIVNSNIQVNNFFIDKLYAKLRIYNLLNTDILYPTHENQLWATKGIMGRSREFLFTLGYKF